MKKTFFLLFLLLSISNLFAQDNQKESKWGIGLQIYPVVEKSTDLWGTNTGFYDYEGFFETHLDKVKDKSYSGGLTGNYYFNKNTSSRLRIGFTKYNITLSDSLLSTGGFISQSETKWNEKHYLVEASAVKEIREGMFGFYGGGGITGKIYGQTTLYNFNETRDSTGGFWSSSETNYTRKNGWAVGIGTFIGARFYIKSFSIGTEFSFAFLLNKYGGKEERNLVGKNAPTGSDFSSSTVYENWYYKWNVSPVYGSLNISYSF